jgi:hypothetical protein
VTAQTVAAERTLETQLTKGTNMKKLISLLVLALALAGFTTTGALAQGIECPQYTYYAQYNGFCACTQPGEISTPPCAGRSAFAGVVAGVDGSTR